MLSADFAQATVETDAANGKVLSYLAAHAEIYRQEYRDSRVIVHCYLPRHLFHHIMGPSVEVHFLDGQGDPS
jgi:GTP-binding protein HflX